jgi:CRISPR-associated protein Cmr5
MQTRQQLYASRVYQQLAGHTFTKTQANEYGAMAHNLAPLIRSAGLCQALQFVKTRNKEPLNILLEHLAKTVLPNSNAEDLIRRSRESELLEYTKLSREVLQALAWFKRFAQSVLGVDASDGNHESAGD